MQTTDRGAETAKQPAPAQSPQEARKHQRALFRGRALVALGLALLALFGAVTAAVLFLDPLALDVPVTRRVQELTFGPAGGVLVAVSAPGFFPWNFVFPAMLIAGLALFRRIAEAGFLALASCAAAVDEVVKALVHRARPSDTLVHVLQHLPSYSFPSGHVTQYTLVFGFCFYLAFTLMKAGAGRTLVLAVCAAMVLLVGLSRIWMGEHWFSDVVGGYTLGCGLLLLVIWAYRAWEARHLAQPGNLPPGDQHAIIGPTAQE